MNITNEGFLPVFTGFYNTIFEAQIEDDNDCLKEEYNLTNKQVEKIDLSDYFDNKEYTKDYAEASCKVVEKRLIELGYIKRIEFQSVQGPRFYNSENDSINVNYVFTKKNLKAIEEALEENEHNLIKFLKDRYTSYSGFFSHYSNSITDWRIEECAEDDHKFSALLEFLLELDNFGTDDIYEDVEIWANSYIDTEKAVTDMLNLD